MKTTRHIFLVAAVAALVCAGAHVCAQEPAPAGAGTNTAKFSGTVTDADGNPVAGATVEYWHSGENPAIRFSRNCRKCKSKPSPPGPTALLHFRLPAAWEFLLAQKPGLAPAWKLLNQMPDSGARRKANLMLTPPGTLAGVVLDESNRPVANAEVYVAMAVGERFA